MLNKGLFLVMALANHGFAVPEVSYAPNCSNLTPQAFQDAGHMTEEGLIRFPEDTKEARWDRGKPYHCTGWVWNLAEYRFGLHNADRPHKSEWYKSGPLNWQLEALDGIDREILMPIQQRVIEIERVGLGLIRAAEAVASTKGDRRMKLNQARLLFTESKEGGLSEGSRGKNGKPQPGSLLDYHAQIRELAMHMNRVCDQIKSGKISQNISVKKAPGCGKARAVMTDEGKAVGPEAMKTIALYGQDKHIDNPSLLAVFEGDYANRLKESYRRVQEKEQEARAAIAKKGGLTKFEKSLRDEIGLQAKARDKGSAGKQAKPSPMAAAQPDVEKIRQVANGELDPGGLFDKAGKASPSEMTPEMTRARAEHKAVSVGDKAPAGPAGERKFDFVFTLPGRKDPAKVPWEGTAEEKDPDIATGRRVAAMFKAVRIADRNVAAAAIADAVKNPEEAVKATGPDVVAAGILATIAGIPVEPHTEKEILKHKLAEKRAADADAHNQGLELLRNGCEREQAQAAAPCAAMSPFIHPDERKARETKCKQDVDVVVRQCEEKIAKWGTERSFSAGLKKREGVEDAEVEKLYEHSVVAALPRIRAMYEGDNAKGRKERSLINPGLTDKPAIWVVSKYFDVHWEKGKVQYDANVGECKERMKGRSARPVDVDDCVKEHFKRCLGEEPDIRCYMSVVGRPPRAASSGGSGVRMKSAREIEEELDAGGKR